MHSLPSSRGLLRVQYVLLKMRQDGNEVARTHSFWVTTSSGFWRTVLSIVQKKYLAQEVRQKSDGGFVPFIPYFATRPLGHCAICKGSSYTKNKYNLFHHNLDVEYFFIQQFFQKKAVFYEKTVKNSFGANLTIFSGKEGSCNKN